MPEFGEDLYVTVILIVCSPAGKDLYLPSINWFPILNDDLWGLLKVPLVFSFSEGILISPSPIGINLSVPSISSANEVVPITPIVDIEIKQDIINDLKFLEIKLPLILYISI